MIPGTTQELERLLTRMQKNGAPKEALQSVFDGFIAQKKKLQSDRPATFAATEMVESALSPPDTTIQDQASVAGRSTGIERPEGAVKEGVKKEDKPYYDASENLGDTNLLDVASTAGIEAGKTIVADLPANLINFVGDITGQEEIAGVVASPFEKAGEVVEGALRSSPTYEPSGETAGEVLGGIAGAVVPAGQGAKLGSALGKAGKTAGFLGSSIGSTAGAVAATEGEAPSFEDLSTGAALDAFITGVTKVPGAAQYLKNNVFTKAVNKNLDDVLKIAEQKGLPKNQLKTIKEQVAQNPEFVDDLFATAKSYNESLLTGSTKAPQAIDIVGDKLKSAQQQLIGGQTQQGSKLADIGQEIGDAIDNLPKKKKVINTEQIYNKLKNELQKTFNITKFDKQMNPVFEGSSISKSAADQKLVMDIWNDIKPTFNKGGSIKQYKALDPRTALAVSDSIDNVVFANAKDLTQAKGIANTISNALDEQVAALSPKLKELQTEYSTLKSLRKDLLAKIKKDGVNSPEALQRLWGNADSVYNDLFTRVQELSKKYGIEEGQNLIPESAVAVTFDNAATSTPTSIGPRVGAATQAAELATQPVKGITERVLGPLDRFIDKVRGIPEDKIGSLELVIEAIKNNKPTAQQVQQMSSLVDTINTTNLDPQLKKALRGVFQALLTQQQGEQQDSAQ